jgi:hypothetical protein
LSAALALAVLFVAYARTLAPGVTWANDGADSGDFVAAAATLGVAHPTGYPTYLLLARLFQLIPLGDLAFRTNLLSLCAALLATLVAYRLVWRLTEGEPWHRAVAAAVAALALGFSPVFWSQALIAEVYALNALFVALLLWFALRSFERAERVRPGVALAEGLLAGLALGNHVTVLIAVSTWLGAVGWQALPGRRWREIGLRVAGVALGLLVYLYLPLRARAHPPVNWGDPRDWSGFWWVVSGELYRGLAFGLPASLVGGRVEAWAGLLIRQFGWLGLALGFGGLLYGAPRYPRFVWLTVAVALLASAFAIAYNSSDSYAYLIPFYITFAIWIGLGAARVLALAGRWRVGPAVAVVALAIWLGLGVASAFGQVDASQDRRAIAFAERVLAEAPPEAIVFTADDRDTFPLWYYHYALAARPDIAVVVEPLMQFDWYRRNLRAVYPARHVPDPAVDTWRAALAEANGRSGRVCRTDASSETAIVCGVLGP